MADDGEVLRQVWHSCLPIVFRLAANEVTSLQEPDPFYAMVSRLSYFPLVMDKVVKHFARFVASNQSTHDLWLEFDGNPLKWHFPVGVLWDLLGTDSVLPFAVTVHFQDFPEDQLVRCSSRAAIESAFMSALKEADALKHRSEVMSALQKKDHNQLWLGVANDKFDQFWAINRKLMAPSSHHTFRYIPFRLYTQDMAIVQKLMKPVTASGDRCTLADLSRQVLDARADEYRLVTHGIEPPLETPLQWLSEHLSYADNFLHICALSK